MNGPREVGRYELRALLGRGGMGQVWCAWDPQLGREVALKLLLSTGGVVAQQAERFRREAEALARVLHPNVIRIHDADVHGGRPYLVMERVEGSTLQARLERGGRLAPRLAVRLVAKLAGALQAVHQAGLLHRDVKPDNVLLNAEDEPLLTDFGLALHRADERLTNTGMFVGTPGYMAPEQAQGSQSDVDARADVYALGAVLYACLTGQPPHGKLDAIQQLMASERLPPAPSQLERSLPRALDAICLRCLQPSREARYPSMQELLADLQAFLRGDAVEPARASRRLVAGGAVLALVGIAAWIGLGQRGEPAEEPAVASSVVTQPAGDPGEPAPVDTPQPPDPAPAPEPAPTWDSAAEAYEVAQEHLRASRGGQALPALEFAFAGDLDPMIRMQAGAELVECLLHGKLKTQAQIALAEQRLARALAVFGELQRWIRGWDDALKATTALISVRSQVEKPLGIRHSWVLSVKGEHDEALRVIEELSKQNQDSLIVADRLAQCLFNLERYEEVIQAAQRIWHDFPKYKHRKVLLGVCYDAYGRLGRLEEQDEAAQILSDTTDSSWMFHHVLRMRERGPQDSARRRYAKQIAEAQARPDDPDAQLARARQAYLLNDFTVAEELCAAVLEGDARSLPALVILAEIAALSPPAEEALELAERILGIDPELALGEVLRARALVSLERYEAADRAAQRALILDPDLAEHSYALVVRSRALRALGNRPERKEVLRRLADSEEPHLREVAKAHRAGR